MLRRVLCVLTGLVEVSARCAWTHEDCSHTGCCMVEGMKCFKKNAWWATCLHSCEKGLHDDEWGPARSPWSCEVVDGSHRDCASKDEDCAHLGCCKDPGHTCYRKDPHWASCRPSCEPGETHLGDPAEHRTPWECRKITRHESRDDGKEWADDGGRTQEEEAREISREEQSQGGHNEDLTQGWKGGLQATHFWDCNGGGCDAALLQPWNLREYKYAPHYAPTDPEKHGGSLYGEKMWLTGAASDALTSLIGPDTDCCGADGDGGGGCGQCLLVKTWESDHPDWLAVIMKKNRCPPWSYGCDKVHMDVAVPGFDNLQYSTANVCGDPSRSDTYISKQQSAICGSVAPKDCNCHQLPGDTPEQRHLRDGCFLFKSWGWHKGTPKLDYRPVPCPKNFVDWVRTGSAFDSRGVKSFNAAGVMSFSEVWNGSSLTGASSASGPLAQTRPSQGRPQPQQLLRLASLVGCSVALLGLVLVVRRGWRHEGELLLEVEEGMAGAEED